MSVCPKLPPRMLRSDCSPPGALCRRSSDESRCRKSANVFETNSRFLTSMDRTARSASSSGMGSKEPVTTITSVLGGSTCWARSQTEAQRNTAMRRSNLLNPGLFERRRNHRSIGAPSLLLFLDAVRIFNGFQRGLRLASFPCLGSLLHRLCLRILEQRISLGSHQHPEPVSANHHAERNV